jgi:hypothetical protein
VLLLLPLLPAHEHGAEAVDAAGAGAAAVHLPTLKSAHAKIPHDTAGDSTQQQLQHLQ